MFELTVEKNFASAHYLNNYDGKCENMHGHNYKVKATVQGNVLLKNGILIDFHELKNYLEEILSEFDHKVINMHKDFVKTNPTAENIACWIYKKLNDKLLKSNVTVKNICVYETDTSYCTYYEA